MNVYLQNLRPMFNRQITTIDEKIAFDAQSDAHLSLSLSLSISLLLQTLAIATSNLLNLIVSSYDCILLKNTIFFARIA